MTTKERRQARRAAVKEGSANAIPAAAAAALTQRCMQAVRSHSALASAACGATVLGHQATCTLTFKVTTLSVLYTAYTVYALLNALQTALHVYRQLNSRNRSHCSVL
jgi:hypothetical protein